VVSPEDVQVRIESAIAVKRALLGQALAISHIAEAWRDALRSGHKVIFFGNGGSAADAQHLECELAGRFYLDRRPLPAISLTVNSSSLTAIGNDYGFEQVFARQLEGVARPGDIAVGISTSGNSPNVVAALQKARSLGLVTVGFTGRSGGRMRELCDLWLPIDSEETPRIQEGHILAGHIACEMVERELFGDNAAACPSAWLARPRPPGYFKTMSRCVRTPGPLSRVAVAPGTASVAPNG
jgi:D-sedoheptulose 7-phosphate isomerase